MTKTNTTRKRTDPVVAITRRLGVALDAYDVIEDEWMASPEYDKYTLADVMARQKRITNIMDKLVAQAAQTQATTASGALFQLCLANSRVDLAKDDDTDAKEMLETAWSLIRSAVCYLEKQTGVDRMEFCGGYYMSHLGDDLWQMLAA